MNQTDYSRPTYRNTIREPRTNYFVEYRPADAGFELAILHLTFDAEIPAISMIVRSMEYELELWISKYPVPTMVTSFDVKGDALSLEAEQQDSHLVGYLVTPGSSIVSRWGTMKNEEFPTHQLSVAYQNEVYKNLPFRYQDDVRAEAIRNARSIGRVLRAIAFFSFGFVILIEAISLGSFWFGLFLSVVSVVKGFYEFAKSMGWKKPTRKDLEKAERKLKMEHYFYHCERNPDAFVQLKYENFVQDEVKKTHATAKELRSK